MEADRLWNACGRRSSGAWLCDHGELGAPAEVARETAVSGEVRNEVKDSNAITTSGSPSHHSGPLGQNVLVSWQQKAQLVFPILQAAALGEYPRMAAAILN